LSGFGGNFLDRVLLSRALFLSHFSLFVFFNWKFHIFPSWINPGLRLGSPATNFLAPDISAVVIAPAVMNRHVLEKGHAAYPIGSAFSISPNR
jgi:hypothetical protein